LIISVRIYFSNSSRNSISPPDFRKIWNRSEKRNGSF
jgi:hypothetical protein